MKCSSTALPDTDVATRLPGCHVLIAKTSSLPRLASKPTKPHVPHFFPAVARFLPANPRLSRLMCPACSPCPAHTVSLSCTILHCLTLSCTILHCLALSRTIVLPVSCSHSASGQERLISYNLPSATEPGNNFTTIFGLGL